MDERLEDLLHREIDGALTGAERAELDERAAADPAVAGARDGWKRLHDVLDRVPAAEPPATLRQDILASLPAPSGAGSWWGTVKEVLAGPRMLAYAGAAAAVSILAFLAGDFWKPVTGPDSNPELTGTLAPIPSAATSTETVLDHERLSGSVRLTREGSAVSLDVDVRPAGPVDLRLSWSHGRLSLGGVAPADTGFTAGEPGTVVLKDLDGSGEPVRVAFGTVSKNGAATIHFQFVADGVTLGEGRLTLPAAGDGSASGAEGR